MTLPNKLFVKQQVEAIEIFTQFETANKYKVLNEQGQELLYAYEEGNVVAMQFFKKARAVKINVIDNNKALWMTVERPFTFMFANHTIKLADGRVLGYIKQHFKIFGSKFDINDLNNQLMFKIESKAFSPWTFKIFQQGNQVAVISKKWGNIGTELFTDADTFLVDFKNIQDQNQQLLILAAAFAIDLRVFEKGK